MQHSVGTKKFWRGVRTSPIVIGKIQLPGFFQIYGFVWDVILFIVVLLLEGFGLFCLLAIGKLQPLVIVFAFLLDLVCAIVRHLWRGDVCFLKNQHVVEANPVVKRQQEDAIQRKEIIPTILGVLIMILAGVKAFMFYVAVGSFNPFVLSVLVSYLIVGILHITVTGYFIWGALTQWLFRRDVRAHVQSGGHDNEALDQKRQINSSTPLVEVDVKVKSGTGSHSLKADPQAGPGVYQLSTHGTLFDDELTFMVLRQVTPDSQKLVAEEALRHQLDISA